MAQLFIRLDAGFAVSENARLLAGLDDVWAEVLSGSGDGESFHFTR